MADVQLRALISSGDFSSIFAAHAAAR